MNFHSHQRQNGFVLIVAVTILMGLLAVVTTLVRVNKGSKSDFEQNIKSDQGAQSLTETGKAWFVLQNTQLPSLNRTRVQRNWSLPGLKKYPYTVILDQDVNGSPGTVRVHSLRHVFLDMAIPDTTAALSFTNMYFIEGNQLLIENGANDIVVGGHPLLHKSPTVKYGFTTGMTKGFLKIGARWLAVSDWDISETSDELVISDPNYRDDTSSLSAFQGMVANYYPFDHALDVGERSGQLSISFVNEQSKINLNSLSQSMVDSLFGATTLGGNYLRSFDFSQNTYVPHYDAESFYAGMGNPTDFSPQGFYQSYNEISTVHSQPKSNFPEALIHDYHTLGGNLLSGQSDWAPVNSSSNLVFQHPLNINGASRRTLEEYFSTMLDTAKASSLAGNIILYRNGDGGTRWIPNPFDGRNTHDINTDAYRAVANHIQYPSPEEEFRAFLDRVSALNRGDIHNIMIHVYNEAFDSTKLRGGLLGQPICFESGDVWTVSVSASSGFKDKPSTNRTETIVAHPISPVDPTDPTAEHSFTINSATGWNRQHSVFNGVTWKQPIFSDITTAAGNSTLTLNENLSRGERGQYHLTNGMLGVFTDAGASSQQDVEIQSYIDYESGFTSGGGNLRYAVSDEISGHSGLLDFGIRPLVSEETDFDNFSGNVTVAANCLSGNTYLISNSNSLVPNDDSLWDGQSLVYWTGSDRVVMEIANATNGSNQITFTAGVTADIPEGSVLYVIPPYHPTYYGGTGGGAAADPYYETVIQIPEARSFKINWSDSFEKRSNAGPKVRVRYRTMANNWANYTEGATITNNEFIGLRFIFDDTTSMPPPSWPPAPQYAPQLFEIGVTYTINPGSPSMYIYERK